MKYVFRALVMGVWRILTHPVLLLMTGGYIVTLWAVNKMLMAPTGDIFAAISSLLHRLTFNTIFILIGLILLWVLGTPKGFLRIMFGMARIQSLNNGAGEIPMLLSRTPTGHGRGEIWEFEAYGVPLSMFIDAQEKLESALDIALVSADNGSDGRKIVLTVVPHPGPWPALLPWDIQKIPRQNSVVVLGENRGEQILHDFDVTPHLICASQSGGGKSVLLKSIMLQLLHKEWTVYLIDYKRGADYGADWESRCALITDDTPLLALLDELYAEMERRYDTMHQASCPNIEVYNSKRGQSMTRVALCFDEVAEALERSSGMSSDEKKLKEQIAYRLSSIARLGRAAGISLVLSTQRGSADVIPPQVRSNVQAICGIANENLSMLTLGTADAHKRIPKTARGRFLTADGTMFQGYYSDFGPECFEGVPTHA